MARADKGMGGGVAGGGAGPNGTQAPGKPPKDGLGEGDLAAETMGDAGAQGPSDMKNGNDDLLSNTREDAPGPQPEPDADVLDSFRKMDKDVRAVDDLGKGNATPGEATAEEAPIELGDTPDKDEPRISKVLD